MPEEGDFVKVIVGNYDGDIGIIKQKYPSPANYLKVGYYIEIIKGNHCGHRFNCWRNEFKWIKSRRKVVEMML